MITMLLVTFMWLLTLIVIVGHRWYSGSIALQTAVLALLIVSSVFIAGGIAGCILKERNKS